MASKKLPKFLQSALWSYDIKTFDPDDPLDKKIIIENVLNHGTDEQVLWVLRYYSPREIKAVLREPSRGSWNFRSLSYWLKFFNIELNKDLYQDALQILDPQTRIPRTLR